MQTDHVPTVLGSWAPTVPVPLEALPARGDASQRLLMAVEASRSVLLDSAAPAAVVALKIVVRGLQPVERRLLEGTVLVSQRRTPRLELLPDEQAADADVVIVDMRDADAMAWARPQPWLHRKAVIWIDAVTVPAGHTAVRRPVQWPVLPMLLARALEQGPAVSPQPPEAAPPPVAAPPDAAAAPAVAAVRPPVDVPSSRPTAATPDAAARPRAGAPPAVAGGPATTVTVAAPPTRRADPDAPSVLVVDDSLAVRNYLRSQLEKRGFAVADAADAQQAIEMATTQSFGAVLMDVLMPGTDGYEACRQIKGRLRGAAAVPVIMLTCKSSPFDRIRGKMAGCDAYLTKPVDPKDLSAVLMQQLGTRTAAHA